MTFVCITSIAFFFFFSFIRYLMNQKISKYGISSVRSRQSRYYTIITNLFSLELSISSRLSIIDYGWVPVYADIFSNTKRDRQGPPPLVSASAIHIRFQTNQIRDHFTLSFFRMTTDTRAHLSVAHSNYDWMFGKQKAWLFSFSVQGIWSTANYIC